MLTGCFEAELQGRGICIYVFQLGDYFVFIKVIIILFILVEYICSLDILALRN